MTRYYPWSLIRTCGPGPVRKCWNAWPTIYDYELVSQSMHANFSNNYKFTLGSHLNWKM